MIRSSTRLSHAIVDPDLSLAKPSVNTKKRKPLGNLTNNNSEKSKVDQTSIKINNDFSIEKNQLLAPLSSKTNEVLIKNKSKEEYNPYRDPANPLSQVEFVYTDVDRNEMDNQMDITSLIVEERAPEAYFESVDMYDLPSPSQTTFAMPEILMESNDFTLKDEDLFDNIEILE